MAKSKQQIDKKKALVVGLIIATIVLVVVLDWGDDKLHKTTKTDNEIGVEDLSALDQMSIAFVGKPLKREIKPLLDEVMRLHNLSITEENYSRAASSLIVLRKDTGVAEIQILKCMTSANVGQYGVKFPESAAICATMLEQQ